MTKTQGEIMLSIEGRELPAGVKNIYWFHNREHALDARRKEKRGKSKYANFYESATKEERRAWWRSLSKQQQLNYIYKRERESRQLGKLS